MSANKTSRSHIEQSLEEIRAERKIATERLFRLFRETFEDGDRAIRSYAKLVREQGIEAAVGALERDDGFFGRHWHFGWMRGGMLAEGNRAKARECLQELPSAMRDHYGLAKQEWDMERALKNVRDRREDENVRPSTLYRREPDRERER